MKKHIKRLAIGLLALLVAFAACACGGDAPPTADSGQTTTDDAAQTAPTYPNGIQPLEGEEPVDLGGYEFTVQDYTDTRWQKTSSGTAYGDAWAQVIKEVEGLYNCKITALPAVTPSEIHATVQNAVAAGQKGADLIVAPQWAYGYLLQNSLMMDLNGLEVNWDNAWWNQNVQSTATVGGKLLATGGSFLEDGGSTWALYYNKRLWKDCGFEDAGTLVDEGPWTQETFAEYCRKAVAGAADYGVVAADGDFCRAWFQALGGQYYTNRSGNVVLGCNNDTASSIVETMREMLKKDRTICTEVEEESDRLARFTGGKSLFYAYTAGAALQNMEDDWGILPLPKRNEAQAAYISAVDQNFPLCGVTVTNQNTKEVGVILEALGRHGMALQGIYWADYDASYWRSEEDARVMAEHIAGHGRYDMAMVMQNCDSALAVPMTRVYQCVFGTTTDFAAYMEAAEEVLTQKINEVFAQKEITSIEPPPTQSAGASNTKAICGYWKFAALSDSTTGDAITPTAPYISVLLLHEDGTGVVTMYGGNPLLLNITWEWYGALDGGEVYSIEFKDGSIAGSTTGLVYSPEHDFCVIRHAQGDFLFTRVTE